MKVLQTLHYEGFGSASGNHMGQDGDSIKIQPIAIDTVNLFSNPL